MMLSQLHGHAVCIVFSPLQLLLGYCHCVLTVSTDEYVLVFPQTIEHQKSQ